jgi:transcriptional regulator with XRE-family HTH domain
MRNDRDNGYIAERLNKLIDEFRRPDGRPYSLRQIAGGVNTRAGEKMISANYLCLLRNGHRRNPGFRTVQAIAGWFGVSVSYFRDGEEPRQGQKC